MITPHAHSRTDTHAHTHTAVWSQAEGESDFYLCLSHAFHQKNSEIISISNSQKTDSCNQMHKGRLTKYFLICFHFKQR